MSEEAIKSIKAIKKELGRLSTVPCECLSGSAKTTSFRFVKRSLKLRNEILDAYAAVDFAVKEVWVLEPPENFVESDLFDPKYFTPGAPL